jgi:hypothetical protein
MNKLIYVMSREAYKAMIYKYKLGSKEKVITYLNQTTGLRGEIVDIDLR